MRRNFSPKVKAQAFLRADGLCEGKNCGARLTVGKFAYDHDLADNLGGEPTLENGFPIFEVETLPERLCTQSGLKG